MKGGTLAPGYGRAATALMGKRLHWHRRTTRFTCTTPHPSRSEPRYSVVNPELHEKYQTHTFFRSLDPNFVITSLREIWGSIHKTKVEGTKRVRTVGHTPSSCT